MNKNYLNHLKIFQLLKAYIARIEHDLKYTIPHNPQTYTYSEGKEVDKTFCEGIPFITIDMASHIFRSIIKEMEIMDSLEANMRTICREDYNKNVNGVYKGQEVYSKSNQMWVMSVDYFEKRILEEQLPFLDKVDEVYKYGEFLRVPKNELSWTPSINEEYVKGYLVSIGGK